MGEKFGEEKIHVYVALSPFAVHLKLLIGYTLIQIMSFKKEKKNESTFDIALLEFTVPLRAGWV